MNFYSTIAPGYDELHGEEQAFKIAKIKQELKIKKSDILLDVGCGTGLSSDFDCKMIGVDPSFELLKANKHTVIQAQGEFLPFKDRVFDVVISITALHHCKPFEKALREAKRVGTHTFVFSVLKKSSDFENIDAEIKKTFSVKKIVDGKQDWIYFCFCINKGKII